MIQGPQDSALLLNQNLPAAGAAVTSGIMDLSCIAPNSDAWRLGRLAVIFPAIPARVDATKTITVEIQVAAADPNNSPAAPAAPVPAAFANANPRQIGGVAGVAATGSPATVLYFDIPLDANGSSYEFVQWNITVPAGDTVNNEQIQFVWVNM